MDTVLLRKVHSNKTCTAKLDELAMPNASRESLLPTGVDSSLISNTEWEKAKQCEAVIKPLTLSQCTRVQAELAGKQLGLSPRQIYKLIQRYRANGSQLRGLIYPKKSGGKGKSRLPLQIEVIIQSAIQEYYLSKQQLKISIIVEEIIRRCFYANLKAPCRNAIYARIQRYSTKEIALKRRGLADAHSFQPVVGSFPNPEYPLDFLQIDHTSVDLIIVDELHRKPIGRPFLTIAIDSYSRCITGFCLSLEPPSTVSVALCLTHSTFEKESWFANRGIESNWPIWGKPKEIYVDNAKEFHSEALERGCDTHGIKIDYRPIGKPHYGSIVERVIGTMIQLMYQLPGTTFSNKAERG